MSEPTHVPVSADACRRLEATIRRHFWAGFCGGPAGAVIAAAYDVLYEAEAARVALGGGEPFGAKRADA